MKMRWPIPRILQEQLQTFINFEEPKGEPTQSGPIAI